MPRTATRRISVSLAEVHRTIPICRSYAYDAAGNMTMRRGDILGDSTNVPENTYDALNRPTYWEQTRGGGIWFGRSHFQYDNVGREAATWREEDEFKGERFTFNTAGHLTRAEYKASNVWTANSSGWKRFRRRKIYSPAAAGYSFETVN
jgi:hypothetical protein